MYLITGFIYQEKVTVTWFFVKLVFIILIFCASTLLSIFIVYISQFHTRMKTVNLSNVKMLDGMHEGLLILSKQDQITMLCNKSARKLFTRAIQRFSKIDTESGAFNCSRRTNDNDSYSRDEEIR